MSGGKGPWMCSRCRHRWSDPVPIRRHIADKHKGVGEPVRVPKRKDADEESFADRAIQASIDRASGIPTDDDWLLP